MEVTFYPRRNFVIFFLSFFVFIWVASFLYQLWVSLRNTIKTYTDTHVSQRPKVWGGEQGTEEQVAKEIVSKSLNKAHEYS